MNSFDFRIRTITLGVNLHNILDLNPIYDAISFLKEAKKSLEQKGYEVQTIRLALPHLHQLINGELDQQIIQNLKPIDDLCSDKGIMLAIGDPFEPNTYNVNYVANALALIENTQSISFHTVIASEKYGMHDNSLNLAAEICHALGSIGEGGEANFRYTASANCPPSIPYFPTSYHSGPSSFGLALESGNLFQKALENSNWENGKERIKETLDEAYSPLCIIANSLVDSSGYVFNGLDVSTAPGLDSSIGQAIESFTRSPFGSASTLAACAMITGALKSMTLKTCGYSGIMLPVIEDKVLAQRASEGRFSIRELLLFSTVCGTGLDVVPIPGDTPVDTLIAVYRDMAALSLKYGNKALSARLFPIPGKNAGEWVKFENPYLTDCRVMSI